jgi:hypothetical protein
MGPSGGGLHVVAVAITAAVLSVPVTTALVHYQQMPLMPAWACERAAQLWGLSDSLDLDV